MRASSQKQFLLYVDFDKQDLFWTTALIKKKIFISIYVYTLGEYLDKDIWRFGFNLLTTLRKFVSYECFDK